MCGIFFTCSYTDCPISLDHQILLQNRGPEASSSLTIKIKSLSVNCFSSVLNLRGEKFVKQPLVDSNNILLFNGEIYNRIDEKKSDTLYLYRKLSECSGDEDILQFISDIEGPFAFVYLQISRKRLWFGRDIIGRRSLCMKFGDNPFFLSISSVCAPNQSGWIEVPADGIKCLDLNPENLSSKNVITHNWSYSISGDLRSSSVILRSQIANHSLNTLTAGDDVEYDEIVMQSYVNQFHEILKDAVSKRIKFFNQKCLNCSAKKEFDCSHSSVAILFSGGIDSTVLAALSDNFVPLSQSIDLLNVAFTKNAPDRLSAISALQELQKISPSRRWKFVPIDVYKENLVQMRDERIKHLIYPQDTVLDDSIGCALWFAAKGELRQLFADDDVDYGHDYIDNESYKCPAKLVLLGMGADEQLAGYSRHRKIFRDGGLLALISEIKREINDISFRNLGRDDRIISDHGREARFPFLDEKVITFLNSIPINYKANLNLARGLGEKMLLRKVALKIGLSQTANTWKRAIQFGSKIANLESKGEKGNLACTRLK